MRDHEVDARFFTHRPTVYPEVPSSTKSNQPSLENTLARDFAIEVSIHKSSTSSKSYAFKISVWPKLLPELVMVVTRSVPSDPNELQ